MGGQTATKASTNTSAEGTGKRSQPLASQYVPSGPYADVLALQRSAGNRAVTQVLEAEGGNRPTTGNVHHTMAGGECSKKQRLGLQTKLTVNEPGDSYEREADRIADQVLAAPEHPAVSGASRQIQRISGQPTGQPVAAPASVAQALTGPGRSLAPALQQDMEQRFGADFSRVRVHAGAAAEQSARDVNAHAYTVGHNLVFGAGRFAPGTHEGIRLLAHELVHVMQQAAGPHILARQPTEQYETRGITIKPAALRESADFGFWGEKIRASFQPTWGPVETARFKNTEERDAVLSVVWQMRPQTFVTKEITHVVTIPKRAVAPASQNLVYQITFRPRKTLQDLDAAEVKFVAEGTAASPVAPDTPSPKFQSRVRTYKGSGFPTNNDRALERNPTLATQKYWDAHPEEQRRVFSWIETRAPSGSFHQVITTTGSSGSTTQSASFEVSGTKDSSDHISDLIIIFLGAVAPSAKTPPAGYASRDFADASIEEAQTTKDPVTQDKLGTIKGLGKLPPDEQPSAKYAIWGYFKNGTRNAEVDAIVPIAGAPSTTPKRVLFTFRFKPTHSDPHTHDVEVERIGEEGKDVSLVRQGDLARVNGFLEHTKDGKVDTLMEWLKKRYPGVTPRGTTIADIEKDVTAKIRAGSRDPHSRWFEANYGITILNKDDAKDWLIKNAVGTKYPQELEDLKDFLPAELQLLELSLEKMSDEIVTTFKDLRLIRQKIYYKFIKGPPKVPKPEFEPQPDTNGVTIPGTTRTIIIFDNATSNVDALFLGGMRSGNKPDVEIATAQTYAHELGHTIEELPNVQKAFDSLVATTHIKPITDVQKAFNRLVGMKPIKPITRYAAKDPSELFAESFALYYFDPEWLNQNWPDLYKFFDTLKLSKPAPIKQTGKTRKPPP